MKKNNLTEKVPIKRFLWTMQMAIILKIKNNMHHGES